MFDNKIPAIKNTFSCPGGFRSWLDFEKINSRRLEQYLGRKSFEIKRDGLFKNTPILISQESNMDEFALIIDSAESLILWLNYYISSTLCLFLKWDNFFCV